MIAISLKGVRGIEFWSLGYLSDGSSTQSDPIETVVVFSPF